jgi:phage terminase large subunit
MQVDLGYEARPAFVPFHAREQRWAVLVAHRRAGKTVSCVMDLIDAALTCQKPEGRFAYIAPTYAQAKDVAWNYLKRFTYPLPGVEQRESDLSVILPNGARVRLYGAENYDRLRGLFFDGVIMDEYGDMDPRAWPEVVRPALADRKGWAVFIGTPKGQNHFYDTWTKAQGDADWFTLRLKASETGILDAKELADARKLLTADTYDQEFECSFDAAVIGAYYAAEMRAAEEAGRIRRVMWEPRVQVHTAWDLGMRDSTAIWFAQIVNEEVRLIDYIENSGVPLTWYAQELRSKPYVYGDHILPHDVDVEELGTGTSRKATLEGLGIRVTTQPQSKVYDGINAVRLLLPRCWFDSEKCKRGIEALKNYRREWDEKRKVFHDKARHDWSSHGSDSFRYLAEGLPQGGKSDWNKPLKYGATGIV